MNISKKDEIKEKELQYMKRVKSQMLRKIANLKDKEAHEVLVKEVKRKKNIFRIMNQKRS